MLATQLLAMTEGAGGLFDFNATLPLMAIQFVLLMVVLTFIFYKPVSKVLEDREEYISGNLTQASDKLIKADELYKQYDEQLKTAKVNAQATIAKAEKEAKAKEEAKEEAKPKEEVLEAKPVVEEKKSSNMGGLLIGGVLLIATLGAVNILRKR